MLLWKLFNWNDSKTFLLLVLVSCFSQSYAQSITASAVPPPTININANPRSINYGSSSQITWSSTNANDCIASGGWNGTLPTSNSNGIKTSALTNTTNFIITCTGNGGSSTQQVTIRISGVPAPVISLTAEPYAISNGSSSEITWSTINADSCNASGEWLGATTTIGNFKTAALTSSKTYTLTCSGAGGTTQQTLTVAVINGNIYYVAPHGSDSRGSGTIDKPWATLAFAVSNLKKPGDSLFVRGGTYMETNEIYVPKSASGTAMQPITIMAYPGESPIIDGTQLPPSIKIAGTNKQKPNNFLLGIDGDYVHVYGLELKNVMLGGNPTGGYGGYGLRMSGTGDTASEMKIHHIWAGGALLQGPNEVFQDSTVYQASLLNCQLFFVNSNPTSKSAAACGLKAPPNPKMTAPGCVHISSSANLPPPKPITAEFSTVQRVISHDCWGEGISTAESYGAIIQDNISYNNYHQNIYLNNAQNALVQRNIAYNSTDLNGVTFNDDPYLKQDQEYIAGYKKGWKPGFSLADEYNDGNISRNQPHEFNPAYNLSSGNTVINNFINNCDVSLYYWTQVNDTGFVNSVFANNTVINSTLKTGNLYHTTTSYNGSNQIHINNKNSIVANNIIFYDNQINKGTVGLVSGGQDVIGIDFSNNLWSAMPPLGETGFNSAVSPKWRGVVTSNYKAGDLTANSVKLLTGILPPINGIALPEVTSDFFKIPRPIRNPVIGASQVN